MKRRGPALAPPDAHWIATDQTANHQREYFDRPHDEHGRRRRSNLIERGAHHPFMHLFCDAYSVGG